MNHYSTTKYQSGNLPHVSIWLQISIYALQGYTVMFLSVSPKGTHIYMCPNRVHTSICALKGYTQLSVPSKGTHNYLCPQRVHTTIFVLKGYTQLSAPSKGTYIYLCPQGVHITICALKGYTHLSVP